MKCASAGTLKTFLQHDSGFDVYAVLTTFTDASGCPESIRRVTFKDEAEARAAFDRTKPERTFANLLRSRSIEAVTGGVVDVELWECGFIELKRDKREDAPKIAFWLNGINDGALARKEYREKTWE